VAYFSVLSQNKLGGIERHYESITLHSLCLARHLNWAPQKYKTEVLPSGSVRWLIVGNARSMELLWPVTVPSERVIGLSIVQLTKYLGSKPTDQQTNQQRKKLTNQSIKLTS
jgi:hypothetical protein